MNTSIRLVDITTGYRNKPVTTGINATLKPGELTCLLGPNGAGKSTLLKTLSAFIPPLSGNIYIDGVDIRRIRPRQLAKAIGVVLTDRPSGADMSVEELVSIGRSPYTSFLGTLRREDRKIVDSAIEMVRIEDLRRRSVATLSDGERQKAMIAKALAQQTGVIFLDEPTAFLDYPSKVEIMKLLFSIARDGDRTVFMSTHDVELAIQMADKIWLLDKTLGLEIGTPEDLALSGSIARYFQRGGLRFNNESASFEIVHDTIGPIGFSGSGSLAEMVKKALRRSGMEPVDIISGIPAVEVKEDNSTILLDGARMADIAQLLDQIAMRPDKSER